MTMQQRGAAKPGILIGLLAVAALGYLAYHTVTSRKPQANVITASGTIEAIEVEVGPRVNGRIARLLVDEGDRVRRGQLIATLDSPELAARVTQARGALLTAEARLADLLAGTRTEQIRAARAEYQRANANALGATDIYGTVRESYARSTELKAALATAESTYRAAQRERDAAQAQLDLVRAGARRETLDNLAAATDQARVLERNAREDLDRLADLHRQGAISAQQYDRARATYEAQRAAVVAADARYREARAGARPEELAAAQAHLDEAAAKLDGARDVLNAQRQLYHDRLDSRQRVQSALTTTHTAERQAQSARAALDLALAGSTRQAIEAARSQVKQARGTLAEALSQEAQIRIVAPSDGIVTVRYREAGEVVAPGSSIVRLADPTRAWVRVYAPLTTLGKITPGQTAEVTTDAYAGKVYVGTVSSIRQEPEFTPKAVQTPEERVKLVYAIRIDVANPAGELKAGMPADARIMIGSVRGAESARQ